MTEMNIIEIAEECGFLIHRNTVFVTCDHHEIVQGICIDEKLQAFADRVAEIARQDQKETDANFCEKCWSWSGDQIANSIRKGDV